MTRPSAIDTAVGFQNDNPSATKSGGQQGRFNPNPVISRISDVISMKESYSEIETAILLHTEAYRRELLRLIMAMEYFQPSRAPWKAIVLHQWLSGFFVPLIRNSEQSKMDIVVPFLDDLGYHVPASLNYAHKESPFLYLEESFRNILRISQHLYDLATNEEKSIMPVEETEDLVQQLSREIQSLYHDLMFHYDEEERCLIKLFAKEGIDVWNQALLLPPRQLQKKKEKYASHFTRSSSFNSSNNTNQTDYRNTTSNHSRNSNADANVNDNKQNCSFDEASYELRIGCIMHAAHFPAPKVQKYKKKHTNNAKCGLDTTTGISSTINDDCNNEARHSYRSNNASPKHGSPKASEWRLKRSRNSITNLLQIVHSVKRRDTEHPWCNQQHYLQHIYPLLPWYTRVFKLSKCISSYQQYHALIMLLLQETLLLTDLVSHSKVLCVEFDKIHPMDRKNNEVEDVKKQASTRRIILLTSSATSSSSMTITTKSSSSCSNFWSRCLDCGNRQAGKRKCFVIQANDHSSDCDNSQQIQSTSIHHKDSPHTEGTKKQILDVDENTKVETPPKLKPICFFPLLSPRCSNSSPLKVAPGIQEEIGLSNAPSAATTYSSSSKKTVSSP